MPADPRNGDWTEAERHSHSFARELKRLERRAKSRPIGFVLLAALLASAVVYKRASQTRVYKARVILRVTEGQLAEDRTPLPRKELRDYVRTVAYTRSRLLTVIEELDLYPARAIRGDDWAVATIRGNLDVDVYRNYFALDRGYTTAQRTARIAVMFRHTDRDKVVKVARRLAEAIAVTESKRRQEFTEAALAQTRTTVARAQRQLAARNALITQTLLARQDADNAGDRARAAQLSAELSRLRESAESDQHLLNQSETMLSQMQLRNALEHNDMGLTFAVVDEHLPEPPPENPWLILAAIGVISFMFSLPLCAIGLAAFDSRVHDLEDVERLGLGVVGHVPGFEGDRVGSFRKRVAAMKQAQKVRRRDRGPDRVG